MYIVIDAINLSYKIGFETICIASSDGVKQSYTSAKSWYGRSCDNGYQGGCNKYRILNENGY